MTFVLMVLIRPSDERISSPHREVVRIICGCHDSSPLLIAEQRAAKHDDIATAFEPLRGYAMPGPRYPLDRSVTIYRPQNVLAECLR